MHFSSFICIFCMLNHSVCFWVCYQVFFGFRHFGSRWLGSNTKTFGLIPKVIPKSDTKNLGCYQKWYQKAIPRIWVATKSDTKSEIPRFNKWYQQLFFLFPVVNLHKGKEQRKNRSSPEDICCQKNFCRGQANETESKFISFLGAPTKKQKVFSLSDSMAVEKKAHSKKGNPLLFFFFCLLLLWLPAHFVFLPVPPDWLRKKKQIMRHTFRICNRINVWVRNKLQLENFHVEWWSLVEIAKYTDQNEFTGTQLDSWLCFEEAREELIWAQIGRKFATILYFWKLSTEEPNW